MKIIPSLIACGLMAAPLYAQNDSAPVVATTQTTPAQTALEQLHPELALIPQTGVDAVFCINRMFGWNELIQLELGKITQKEIDEQKEMRREYIVNEPLSISYAGSSATLENLLPLSILLNLVLCEELNILGTNEEDANLEAFPRIFEQLLSKYPNPLGEGKIAPLYMAVSIEKSEDFLEGFSLNGEGEIIEHQGFKGIRLSSAIPLEYIESGLEQDKSPKARAFIHELYRRDPMVLIKTVDQAALIVLVEDLADIAAMPENASASLLGSPLVAPLQAAAKEKDFIAAGNMPVSLLRKLPIISMCFPSGAAEMMECLPLFYSELGDRESKGIEKFTALLQSLAADAEQGNAFFAAQLGKDAVVDVQLDLPCRDTPFLSAPKAAPSPAAEGELMRLSLSPRRAPEKPLPGLGLRDAPAMLALSKLMFPQQAKPGVDRILAAATTQALAALSQPKRTQFSLGVMGQELSLSPSMSQESWQGLELLIYTSPLAQLGDMEWKTISESCSLEVKKYWNSTVDENQKENLIELTEEEKAQASQATLGPKPVLIGAEDQEIDIVQRHIDYDELMRLYPADSFRRSSKEMAEYYSSIRFTVQPVDGKHKLRLQFLKK